MPGHILIADCPCGFSQGVKPGAHEMRGLYVIAYDPDKPDLITVEEKEAVAKGLTILPNPFLQYTRRPMSDPEVQRLGGEPTFVCPKCGENSMRFGHSGFWD